MGTERTDLAKSIVQHFAEDLNSLDSPNSYRQFALQYFADLGAKEFVLNAVTMCELASKKPNDWPVFRRYFLWKAHQQFSKRTSQLKDLDTELGFMSR